MNFFKNKNIRCGHLPIDNTKDSAKDAECAIETCYGGSLKHSIAGKMAVKTESGDLNYLNTSQKSIDMLTKVFKENKFALKRKKLARMLSLNGMAGLLIEPVEKYGKQTLYIEPVCIMNPITYLDELLEVTTHSDHQYCIGNDYSPLHTKYLYEEGKVVAIRYGMFDNKAIPASKFTKLKDREVLEVSKIPVTIFMNNEVGSSDLYFALNSVDLLEKLFNELEPEWAASSTKFIMNSNFLGGTLTGPIKSLLTKIGKNKNRVVELKSGDSKFGDAINQLFTLGKLPELRDTIDWLENRILDIANLPNDDPEEGKNNKHTEEVLMKQQSANENIISRIEIRQEFYTDFVRLCLEMLGSPDRKIEVEMEMSKYQDRQLEEGGGGTDESTTNPEQP